MLTVDLVLEMSRAALRWDVLCNPRYCRQGVCSGGRVKWLRRVERVSPAASTTSICKDSTPIEKVINGDNDSGSSARQTCSYKRAYFSFVHPRWDEVDHRRIEQYYACLQDRIRWRTYKYRRLPRAEYWCGFNC